MILHDLKRQRRLRRLATRKWHAKRLRIAKVSYLPPKLGWWQRFIRLLKSFFDAKPKPR